MVVGGPLKDPTPEFKKRVGDVQEYGPYWICASICGVTPCCCCCGVCMTPCSCGMAHKTQTFETPVDEEECCMGCCNGEKKENLKSWITATKVCGVLTLVGFAVVMGLAAFFMRQPMACKITSREKCVDCFKKNDTKELIMDKYGDSWWEPMDRKACHYGVGPFNVTDNTLDTSLTPPALRAYPMVWADPLTGSACINDQDTLKLEGKTGTETTYVCAYTAIGQRSERTDGETGDKEVVDATKAQGGQGKMDQVHLIDWYKDPAMAETSGYDKAQYTGYYNNETELWDKTADHMFLLCADDRQAQAANGKSCEALCNCMGGEYLLNPMFLAMGLGAIVWALMSCCWTCAAGCLVARTDSAYDNMLSKEQEVKEYEERVKMQQDQNNLVGAAMGGMAAAMAAAKQAVTPQQQQQQPPPQQQPPQLYPQAPPPQPQPVYQQQPQPVVYQQQPQPYQQQPQVVYQQQPQPVYAAQQPQVVYQQQPQANTVVQNDV